MSDETILAGIREILEDMEAHSAGERIPLSRDVHLVRDLDLDSLKRIELVIRIENEFRVRLEPEDEEEITTLGDLVDIVRRRRA
jgi:acyl carrier protein